MGWETRRGKQYYYRKVKFTDADGRTRVRSIYCGGGARGEAAAREDEERWRVAAAPAPTEPPAVVEERAPVDVDALIEFWTTPQPPPSRPAGVARRRYRRSSSVDYFAAALRFK